MYTLEINKNIKIEGDSFSLRPTFDIIYYLKDGIWKEVEFKDWKIETLSVMDKKGILILNLRQT